MMRWLRSAGAIAAGFLFTATGSIAADAIMHAVGVFPQQTRDMSGSLFALASTYRAAFTVAGGYVAARLAAERPMWHASILAAAGLVGGTASVIAYFYASTDDLGPVWYALSIPAEAVPCALLGGKLASMTRPAEQRF